MVPRLSIVIPAYNYADYIQASVRSVLEQMLETDQLVVVNDGSTDDTSIKLEELDTDHRLQVIYQENSGVSDARNNGVQHASGEYIVFLDADDTLIDGALDLFRAYIGRHPECDLVSAGRETVDVQGKHKVFLQPPLSAERERNFVDYVIHKKFSLANGAICIRRSILDSNRFPSGLKVSEDFCLYAQLLANYTACSFPEPTVLVRKHAESLRNQLDYFVEANELLIDTLFDPGKLPAPLLGLKRRFYCQRLLSLFRARYLAGDYGNARKTYLSALGCRPYNIVKLSYLRKFIRSLLK